MKKIVIGLQKGRPTKKNGSVIRVRRSFVGLIEAIFWGSQGFMGLIQERIVIGPHRAPGSYERLQFRISMVALL